jgi:hypothetical protein
LGIIQSIDYITIYKSQKWWEAVVVFESFGRRTIATYLWNNKDGTWKRKQKFQIRTTDEWNKVKNAIEQLIPKLQPETQKPEPSQQASSP